MSLQDVDNSNFAQIVGENKPTLVKVYATWCGPCKMLTPVIENIATKNTTLNYVQVDVDKAPEVVSQLRVTGVPCLILFKSGIEINRLVGYNSETKVQEFLNKYVPIENDKTE